MHDIVGPITTIVNNSLNNFTVPNHGLLDYHLGRHVPNAFKIAIVKPIPEYSNSDIKEMRNFRTISRLPLFSKVLEKAVAGCPSTHITSHNLLDKFKSAYRSAYHTETSRLRVHHDFVNALDGGCTCAVVLFDLTAAFDCIDHTILMTRLQFSCGIDGRALNWFR